MAETMNTLNTAAPAHPGDPSGQQQPLKGVLLMLASGLCFVSLTAGVKHMGSDIPAAQSAFLRYALGLVFLLPMLPAMRRAKLYAATWRAFGWRGLAHMFAVILWFYAMTRIPLAEVSAMGYLNPIYTTIGAALFLGEPLRLRRILAIGVAILGALVILRPGMRELNSGHLAMLGTSFLFAVSYMIARKGGSVTGPFTLNAVEAVNGGMASFSNSFEVHNAVNTEYRILVSGSAGKVMSNWVSLRASCKIKLGG